MPELRLRGEWLRKAGFGIGTVTEVLVDDARLTITARAKAGPPPTAAERERFAEEEYIEALREDLRPDTHDFFERDPDEG
ncbi:MAG: type I toxin-antitoxin system SymE family toxin [Planctomycetales bacterium]|nr:type I toxin-antitoxin system SymE family toxin [Planctomycetales bacterium]